MATSTLSPQPVPNPPEASTGVPPSLQSAPSVLDEVRAAQSHLRTRLAGALTKPPPNTPPSLLPTVPLIDLRPSLDGTPDSRRAVVQAIREACLTTGFFQISNHGITSSATSGILAQAARFFHDLTPTQKDELHIRHSPLFRGYEPGDYTYVNPDDDTRSSNPKDKTAASTSESKQGFNLGYEPALDPTGGDGKYVELDGTPPAPGNTNVWPSESDLPGFKAGVAEYYGQVLALARHMFRLFALSLDLEESYFDKLTTHPGGIGRLLYYPSSTQTKSEGEGEGKLGLGAHTDYECFTLLLADSNPGLEILFPPSPLTDNKPLWRPCPVRPGTLTVNVADFLMRWTNGLYKSTVHRVMSKPGAPARYSVPFFFSINYDAAVEGLPERSVGRNVFKPMKAGQYVLERLRATKTLGEGVDDVGTEA
jgi:isopenicillin N synthase-like dioxygenase